MADPVNKRKHPSPAQRASQTIKQAKKEGVKLKKKQRKCAEGGEPCALASCPICRERMNRNAIAALHERYDTSDGIQTVTITPVDGRVEFNEWDEFDLEEFIAQNVRRLRETLPEGTEVFGGVDVSVNSFKNNDRHLHFHFHAFLSLKLDKKAKAKVRKRYARSRKAVATPVKFKWWSPDVVAEKAGYMWKWFYQGRSSFLKRDGNQRTNEKRTGRQQLKRRDNAIIAAILQKYHVTDLLFMVGVKRQRSSDPITISLMSALPKLAAGEREM